MCSSGGRASGEPSTRQGVRASASALRGVVCRDSTGLVGVVVQTLRYYYWGMLFVLPKSSSCPHSTQQSGMSA
eukprot:scaffold9181_cov37-Tisochrysis_lutea.AAC.1